MPIKDFVLRDNLMLKQNNISKYFYFIKFHLPET